MVTMDQTELFPANLGKAFPRVMVVWVTSPPCSLSLFFILEEGNGFELGCPEKALEVADREVRARRMTARQRDELEKLIPAGLTEAARLRAAVRERANEVLEQKGDAIPQETDGGISLWDHLEMDSKPHLFGVSPDPA